MYAKAQDAKLKAISQLPEAPHYVRSFGERMRREWDSNPRYGCPYNDFRDRPIRPLWHLSDRESIKYFSTFLFNPSN